MRSAAVVLTFGRECLSELLGMIERQTMALPVLLYVDDAPWLTARTPWNVELVHSRHFGPRDCIGPARGEAVRRARELFGLAADDLVLVLDDDDYYHPLHFELTTAVAERALWVGAARHGWQRAAGWLPELVTSKQPPGPHAAWAFRLSLYDRAGGYGHDLPFEDRALAVRMGEGNCQPYQHLTHVRRQLGANLSGAAARMDRHRLRSVDTLSRVAQPIYSEECRTLELWCEQNR